VLELTIAVSNGDVNPMGERGALEAVTPQEEVLAPQWALGHLIQTNKIDAADAEKWKKFYLTALLTFKLIKTSEEREFETIKQRQKATLKHLAISYTPVQWVWKVMQMKLEREKANQGKRIPTGDIAQLFKKYDVKPAKGQEEITGTFVENAEYVRSLVGESAFPDPVHGIFFLCSCVFRKKNHSCVMEKSLA